MFSDGLGLNGPEANLKFCYELIHPQTTIKVKIHTVLTFSPAFIKVKPSLYMQ